VIIEHAEFQVTPGACAPFEEAYEQVRTLLLSADGCRSVALLPGVDVADTYLLRVEWDRLADHTEVFAASPEAEKLRNALAPHCAAPPRVVHYAADVHQTNEGVTP
jgi:heme-degrading monooxygenase HmoA